MPQMGPEVLALGFGVLGSPKASDGARSLALGFGVLSFRAGSKLSGGGSLKLEITETLDCWAVQ